MKKILLLFIPLLLLFGSQAVNAQEVFINEIHYDNTGTDTEEAIEIAGPAGTDLTGWSIVLYNGANGQSYDTDLLSGIIPDISNGFGFISLSYPVNGLQNGAPDGIALIDNDNVVIQFLSYEGSFTAVNGVASGLTSVNIGVSESGSDPIGFSLQLGGTGKVYTDFAWQSALTATSGALNTNQNFVPAAPVVFINEIHYDNTGTDTGEAIELAGTAGADLTGWQIILYNGSGGAPYNTKALSGIFTNQDNGFGTITFIYPSNGIQNGAPDGLALINPSNEVIQFLSYEGTFTAVGGLADGLLSTDIGVRQAGTEAIGTSLQLQGTGNEYADFIWSPSSISSTFNTINTGQGFGGVIVDPEPEILKIAIARTKPLNTELTVIGVVTASDQLGGPAFIQDETGGIAVFDTQVHGAGLFQIGDSLKITAKVGRFNQQVQLVSVTDIEVFGPAENPILPKSVSIAQIGTLEGQLVSIPLASFNPAKGLLFPESNYTITDGTGNLQLRIDGDVTSLIGRLIPTSAQTITGVLGSFNGTIQVFPRFIEDLPGTADYEPAGSDTPISQTLDVMTWNMEFFGSTITNFGPSNVQLQKDNALSVLLATLPDVVAVQEISDDALLQELINGLPGYALICSDRFSYSFDGPDPTFPEQKICFLYNTAVVEILNDRVVFEELYDQARLGSSDLLDTYPTGDPSSFWSSGRLPYLVEARVNINGVKERINFINIHAKSGGSSLADYNRRTYDIQVLKDTLNTYYPEVNVVLLGDYNDDLDVSIYQNRVSPYGQLFAEGALDGVTVSLSEAGFRSFITADNVIDHITISDELYDNYLEGSEQLFLPFDLISNYLNTTSDHLPVSVRFVAGEPLAGDAGEGGIVYLGYEPLESITLTASDATGGSGIYTYTWSDGQVGQSIVVSPTMTTIYTLTITDDAGNIFTDEVQVCVVDVRCGNSGDKVLLSMSPGNSGKTQTICVAKAAVAGMLSRGATLGNAAIIPCEDGSNSDSESLFASAVIRSAYPNPMDEKVTLTLDKDLTLPVAVILFNEKGDIVFSGNSSFENGKLEMEFSGNSLKKGFYYLHTNYGAETKVTRLMKK
jgi:hypothetical protein